MGQWNSSSVKMLAKFGKGRHVKDLLGKGQQEYVCLQHVGELYMGNNVIFKRINSKPLVAVSRARFLARQWEDFCVVRYHLAQC